MPSRSLPKSASNHPQINPKTMFVLLGSKVNFEEPEAKLILFL